MIAEPKFLRVREFDADGNQTTETDTSPSGGANAPSGIVKLLRVADVVAVELHRADRTSVEFSFPADGER